MKRYSGYIAAFLLVLIGAIGITGCKSDTENGTIVLTTKDQVQLEYQDEVSLPPPEVLNAIPEEAIESLKEKGGLVLTYADTLVEGGEAVPLVPGGDVNWDLSFEAILGTAFDVGKIFIPTIAAWEGVAALFLSQRKRRNYGKAFNKLAPKSISGQAIDIPGAVRAIVAALGINHSTKEGEVALESEIEGGNQVLND